MSLFIFSNRFIIAVPAESTFCCMDVAFDDTKYFVISNKHDCKLFIQKGKSLIYLAGCMYNRR